MAQGYRSIIWKGFRELWASLEMQYLQKITQTCEHTTEISLQKLTFFQIFKPHNYTFQKVWFTTLYAPAIQTPYFYTDTWINKKKTHSLMSCLCNDFTAAQVLRCDWSDPVTSEQRGDVEDSCRVHVEMVLTGNVALEKVHWPTPIHTFTEQTNIFFTGTLSWVYKS